MQIFTYILISFISFFDYSFQSDLEKEVFMALRNSEAKEIGKYFTSSLKISIDGDEQVSTKYQGELIVAGFMNKNHIQELEKVVVTHDDNKSYLVFEEKVDRKQLRILLKLAKIKNVEYIAKFHVK